MPKQPQATKEQRQTFAFALAEGLGIPQASERAGMAKSWGYLHRDDPDIAAIVEQVLAPARTQFKRRMLFALDRAGERITECMEPGRTSATGELNLKAALAVAKLAEAEPAQKQEVSGPNGAPPVIHLLDYSNAPALHARAAQFPSAPVSGTLHAGDGEGDQA